MIGPTVAVNTASFMLHQRTRYVICMKTLSSKLGLRMKMAIGHEKGDPKSYSVNWVICLGYTNLLENN